CGECDGREPHGDRDQYGQPDGDTEQRVHGAGGGEEPADDAGGGSEEQQARGEEAGVKTDGEQFTTSLRGRVWSEDDGEAVQYENEHAVDGERNDCGECDGGEPHGDRDQYG